MVSRKKRSHKNGKFANVSDRISSLPDPILHHILSFVTTKEAVATSVLSKRWTYLWTFVPVLDFDVKHFKKCGTERRKVVFENFVDHVLLFRQQSNLDRFGLNCGTSYSDENHIFRWILYAISCNTKVLNVEIDHEELHRPFPDCIFGCQSLEQLMLSLDYSVDLGPPKFLNGLRRLDSLRILKLYSITFRKGFLDEFISACPVLEDVELAGVVLDSVNICSNSIKRLYMFQCFVEGDGLQIFIPSLLSLTMSALDINNVTPFKLDNLSSLLYAEVPAMTESQFLGGLVNASTIVCTEFEDDEMTDEDSMKELSKLPTFNNLKHLTIPGRCTKRMRQVFACFLQRSPNLETYKCFGQKVKTS